VLDQITPSERKVAEFIIKDPHSVVSLSVAELSKCSGGSQAAIIRLCKSMGVKGFKELMLQIAGDLQEDNQFHGYQDIRPGDSVATIVNNVSNNNIQSIRDTLKIIDIDKVTEAIEAIHHADRLYFYGIGASNLIAQDAQQKFMRINKTSISSMDPHLQLTSAVTLTKRDVAVGISYSGETEHVIASLRNAKQNGAVTISISKYGTTTLSSLADIPLYTSSTENEIRSGAMASRITQLNIIDILYLGVASRSYKKSVKYLEKSHEAIKLLTNRK